MIDYDCEKERKINFLIDYTNCLIESGLTDTKILTWQKFNSEKIKNLAAGNRDSRGTVRESLQKNEGVEENRSNSKNSQIEEDFKIINKQESSFIEVNNLNEVKLISKIIKI